MAVNIIEEPRGNQKHAAFLGSHQNNPYGVRFSTNNHLHTVYEKIHSYRLYAIAKMVVTNEVEQQDYCLLLFYTKVVMILVVVMRWKNILK